MSSDNEVQFNVNVDSEQNSSLLDAADNFSDQRDENGELYDAQDERNMEDYENPNFNGESRSKYRAPGDAEQYGYQTQYNDADDYDSIDSSNDPDSGANAGADIKREEHLNVPNRNSSGIKKMVSQLYFKPTHSEYNVDKKCLLLTFHIRLDFGSRLCVCCSQVKRNYVNVHPV